MSIPRILFLRHQQVDKKKWDETIAQSTNGIIYAWSWYLDIISPGWNALITDDYSTLFPLTGKRKFGIDYLYPPFFSQQLGLFSKEKITPEMMERFIDSIPEKYKFLEINLNTENFFNDPGFEIRKNITHHLSLHVTYETIKSNYSENLRRNLKKGYHFNPDITGKIIPEELISLFRNNRGAVIKNLNDSHYLNLKKLFFVLQEKNAIDYRSCYHNGNLLAGAAFIRSHRKIIFLFSATGKEGKERFVLPTLIDSYIRENSGREMVFDFEGSNDADLARFYKSYGAKEIIYLQVKKNRLPAVLKIFKK